MKLALFVAALLTILSVAAVARADIFQWEYINPADPSQGKRQSTTLAPDGAGVDPVPGVDLSGRNLTMADLVGADLTDADGIGADLTNADLRQTNLTNAILNGVTLLNADFTGAQLRGANFGTRYCGPGSCGQGGTGITLEQIYSTASYKAHDLSDIGLSGSNLAVGNFAGKNFANADFGDANLTGADFRHANLANAKFFTYINSCSYADICWGLSDINRARLTEAEFSDADVRGASFSGLTVAQLYSTASYRAQDLSGIDVRHSNLVGGNFAGQNLSNASFYGAELTDADFTDAEVRGASFSKDYSTFHNFFGNSLIVGTGITLAQLYSTASYRAYDLTGINLVLNDLTGGILAGQNLTNANFAGATLSGANFAGADARAAYFGSIPSDAIATNLIRPDGRINGLGLNTGVILVLRDYDGDSRYEPARPPIPITVDQHFAMGPDGTLRMVFEADAWDSTISFTPGIPVTLGGTLELTFAGDVNLASQVGRMFDLFDWTGVAPAGALTVSSPYRWDLSQLYTIGEVTLTAIPEPTALILLFVGAVLLYAPRRGRFVLSVVLISACAPSTFAELPMTGIYIPELQAVDLLLQNFMVGKPIPGGTIAITHDDKVIYERGIGYSNEARTVPMQETAMMRLASVSKPITASAIQQLAKDGQISLDDKVFNIDGNGGILNITPYNGTLGDSRLRDITLQHLLEHKGGWNSGIAGDMAFQDLYIATTIGVPSPPGIANSARYILSRPLQFTPGSAENYSNIGYMFLGMVVEAASGQAYESYVENHVLAPAGIPAWEVDAGRTFAENQNPREPVYSSPDIVQNVYNPGGPLVSGPYGGWDHEKALAYGGLIASSKGIALLAQSRIASGPDVGKLRSESTTNPQNIGGQLGALPGTLTLMVQESSKDWTYSILFDQLPAGWSSESISLFDSLNLILDGLTTWPEALVYAGDFTNDQWLTLDDVMLFKQALALGSQTAFTTAYPLARYSAGDFDGDGQVNASDAVGFVSALQHAGVPAEFTALVPELPGDYNRDGGVDAADYVVWRDNVGATVNLPNEVFSLGVVDESDYELWRSNFGNSLGARSGASPSAKVPEPSALLLIAVSLVGIGCCYPPRRRPNSALQFLPAIFPFVAFAAIARADIYQWEYINPADPSQGRQQSTTLAPDGAGVDAMAGADLSGRNLTMAYLNGADLANASGPHANLTNADMTRANLANADLTEANLTNASFFQAMLTNSDFSAAEVRGASFGFCSYFVGCQGSGINSAQLYSTASYQAHDLSGIGLSSHDFAGGRFERQNLQYADFGAADLTAASFREANLTNVLFVGFRRSCHPLSGCNYVDFAWATLTAADFTSADMRGAILYAPLLSYAKTTNLIQLDGYVSGLDLDAGSKFVVRNYDGDSRFEPAKPPIPITIDEHLVIGPGGVLRMVFETDEWDSTIAFAPGIPVALGGTLELTFAADVNLASQVGRTFDLFDWTGVTPTGVFTVASPYAWDLSRLYTTGEVTLTAVSEPSGLFLLSCVLAATIAIRRRANLLPSRALQVAASMFSVVVFASAARADIFQWEYINPADPSQGKQQSTTLCPDGAGVDALPGADLGNRNLTMAYLVGADLGPINYCQRLSCGLQGSNLSNTNFTDADLTSAKLDYANLSGANLRRANLTEALLYRATLTDADLTDAEVRGAYLPGLALAQLYSTASYQAHDLSGVKLLGLDLTSANFVGKKLTNVGFQGNRLTDADFTDAEVRGAFFSRLTTDGSFVQDAGITPDQLYSTASYQSHDLAGIGFDIYDLSGWNLAGQDLTNAYFRSSTVTGADFTAADTRGAAYLDVSDATNANLIQPDGHVDGLNLGASELLVVRDNDVGSRYDSSSPPIPITVDQHLEIGSGGTLRMEFEADAWDSTISFAPGIPVALGGALELTFTDDVNLASQVGRTFDLFDWTGVHPSGEFSVASRYVWNLSDLYTTGEVTLTAVPEPSALLLLGFGVATFLPMRCAARNRRRRLLQIAASLLPLVSFATSARADIYQWEYINPADPSQGKQQSTTLAPDGAGVDAVPGADLSYRDLTMADLDFADLTGANLSQANFTNASFAVATLTDADVRDANLASASFAGANLTGADFAGAEIRGANFAWAQFRPFGTGIALDQLYTTASYQARDLGGISFYHNDLARGNFSGQNLSEANFERANLSGVNFRDANLTNAIFGRYYLPSGTGCCWATLTDADLTAADAHGAFQLDFAFTLSGEGTAANLIGTSGDIYGLDLDVGGLLIVRDYDGGSQYVATGQPIPITVFQNFAMGSSGTLRMVLEADAWDSKISFAPGIPVALGGTLELTFAADVNLAGQVGRTFDLFDWTGVTPTGAFTVPSPYTWDLSRLYTTGEVTLTAVSEPSGIFLSILALAVILATRRANSCDRPVLQAAASAFVIFTFASAAWADIFQWEYINPADPSQGKQQSTTLAPDGAGLDAVPGADLIYRNLSMAYLIGTNLTNAYAGLANLSNADFSNSELKNASFIGATLTDANFAGAQVHGAHFDKQHVYSCSFYCFEIRDGTGVTPAQVYSTASYHAGDLSTVDFAFNDLAGGNFASQNLANASFRGATLTGADFTGAEVRGTSFAIDSHFGGTGVSAAQLRSTASYQNHDLSGVNLSLNNLAGANFVGQNLNNVNFTSAVLTDADFTGAEIWGANFTREWSFLNGSLGTGITPAQLYSTATYERRDLSGIDFSRNDFSGASFAGQNLTNVNFTAANLIGADFSGAEIRGAKFDQVCHPYVCDGSGITPTQLYSTSSYQSRDLSGVSFLYNKLDGVNLAGQNLTNTNFGYYLGYGDFYDFRLTGANLNGADARGASGFCDSIKQCTGAAMHNLIRPDGYIRGLDLNAGDLLVVRDYDGGSAYWAPDLRIPITVDQHLAMGPGGTLRMVLEADAWDSKISFAPGIPVTLGGTLDLTFAPDVNLASQVGRTFDLFDWTGVSPTGAFAVSSPYAWDLSDLYTTGEVTLTSIPEPSTVVPLIIAATGWCLRRGRVA